MASLFAPSPTQPIQLVFPLCVTATELLSTTATERDFPPHSPPSPATVSRRIPNTFLMYKADFPTRYAEVCTLERSPSQRMRIAARMWDFESTEVRAEYESRYRVALNAAGVKSAIRDPHRRRARTQGVTAARRAKRATEGATLNPRSELIFNMWHSGLRGQALVRCVREWDAAQSGLKQEEFSHKSKSKRSRGSEKAEPVHNSKKAKVHTRGPHCTALAPGSTPSCLPPLLSPCAPSLSPLLPPIQLPAISAMPIFDSVSYVWPTGPLCSEPFVQQFTQPMPFGTAAEWLALHSCPSPVFSASSPTLTAVNPYAMPFFMNSYGGIFDTQQPFCQPPESPFDYQSPSPASALAFSPALPDAQFVPGGDTKPTCSSALFV
ncbi:hypothetical protein BKA62DRAFT_717443 [Auriculariales sp. MPI-PUGE-AT-0066]|nr:hypothetical protein BKA62DRAFT_717443 [Auriculariales sp. MPI-PUGE-AT-0066]